MVSNDSLDQFVAMSCSPGQFAEKAEDYAYRQGWTHTEVALAVAIADRTKKYMTPVGTDGLSYTDLSKITAGS